MTPQALATVLNGRPIGAEISTQEALIAKEHGLVVVYGYSDDNVELEGAIDDEIGANDGTTLRITPAGLLPQWPEDGIADEEEAERYFRMKALGYREIEARWAPTDPDCSWAFVTEIPHATFDVMEDGELFCRGIVFRLEDAKP